MKDDPKRPYKALVGASVAAAGGILAGYQDVMPVWLAMILTGVVAGGAAYMTPNPKV